MEESILAFLHNVVIRYADGEIQILFVPRRIDDAAQIIGTRPVFGLINDVVNGRRSSTSPFAHNAIQINIKGTTGGMKVRAVA